MEIKTYEILLGETHVGCVTGTHIDGEEGDSRHRIMDRQNIVMTYNPERLTVKHWY